MTIGGAKGKWTKVSWQGREGWVFGGFLFDVTSRGSAAFEPAERRMLTTHKGKDVVFRPCFADTPVDTG